MSADELQAADPLRDVAAVLQREVPIAAGLPARVGHRARRQARARTATASAAGLLALVATVWVTQTRRTGDVAVTFALDAPAVQSVALVGDFTDWRTDRVSLHPDRHGQWEVTVKLPPGRYRFAYVVNDGEWRADAAAAPVPDDFGRPTSVVTVTQ